MVIIGEDEKYKSGNYIKPYMTYVSHYNNKKLNFFY